MIQSISRIGSRSLANLIKYNLPLLPFCRAYSEKGGSIFIHRKEYEKGGIQQGTKFTGFTGENQRKAQEILAQYPPQYAKAAIIPLLMLGQRQANNFCSLDLMNHVAKMVDVPPMRVYEVATFYTMFNRIPAERVVEGASKGNEQESNNVVDKPIGSFFVQVCATTPCQLCGSDEIARAVLEETGAGHYGSTSSDSIFTVVEVECAGACVNAPVMAINDDYFEDLTPETARNIIKAYRDHHKDWLAAEVHANDTVSSKGRLPPGIKVGPQPRPISPTQTAVRDSCEPANGQTTLLEDPTTPVYLRVQDCLK